MLLLGRLLVVQQYDVEVSKWLSQLTYWVAKLSFDRSVEQIVPYNLAG